MDITIETLGAIAGSLMTIIGLIAYFVKPVINTSKELNKTITSLDLTLNLLKKDLEASKEDRKVIHAKLDRQDERLDAHELKLAEHGQQIKTLFTTKETVK